MASTGELWANLSASLDRLFWGYLLGGIPALLLGLAMGLYRPIRALVDYLRKMAIDGYYTSKEGLKELDYRGNSFYSESPGCTH